MEQVANENKGWYAVHTYSGYENKVLDTLTRKVHSMGMEDTIKEILHLPCNYPDRGCRGKEEQ